MTGGAVDFGPCPKRAQTKWHAPSSAEDLQYSRGLAIGTWEARGRHAGSASPNTPAVGAVHRARLRAEAHWLVPDATMNHATLVVT